MIPKKQVLIGLFGLFIMSSLLLVSGQVNAQDNQPITVCGYLFPDPNDPGYLILTTGNLMDVVASLDMKMVGSEPGWIELTGVTWTATGRLREFSGFRRVESCVIKNNIKPGPANKVLRLSPACSSKVNLTIDKTGVSSDWQKAIESAAMTWGQSGSKLVISYGTVTDSQRTFTLLDYDGKSIDVDKKPLTLAPCEVRVVMLSRIPSTYITSFEKSLVSAGVRDYSTSGLAGWVQPFSTEGKYSNAVLVIINDKSTLKFSTGVTGPLIVDLETIVLHELGHAFGVDHIKGIGSAMSADTADHIVKIGGVKQRFLSPADRDAIRYVFGSITFEKYPGSAIHLKSPMMYSESIKKMQQRLLDLGYLELGVVDGLYGQKTESAVKRFQVRNELYVDGIVNEVVWNLIFSKP